MESSIGGFEPSWSGARSDYYMKLTEFKRGGRFEAVVKVVRPMQFEAHKKRWEESFARTPGYAKPKGEGCLTSSVKRITNVQCAGRGNPFVI